MIKLAIIEDDPNIRSGLERYLSFQKEIHCALAVDSVEAFLEGTTNMSTLDVVLSDIGLPGKSGVEGIFDIKNRFPDVNILMFSVHKDSERVFRAICNGATGYLVKTTPLPKVKEAIVDVHKGDAAMSPSIARKVIEYFRPQKKDRKELLTTREKQIVQALVEGLSYKMVAERLQISFETVKQHIKNIYKKLEINSKAELISRSYRGEL